MTEDEARGWIGVHYGPDAQERLARLVALVVEESSRQNLVSRSSLDTIWNRHVLDSLQLVGLAEREGDWLDIGTGAGFPGLAVACVREAPMTLVEPRPLRVAFLRAAAEAIGLANVVVVQGKADPLRAVHAVVSARAVASLDRLFSMSSGITDATTRFVFPRGRHAGIEVAEVQRKWRGVFHVEQSLSDPDAAIVVADEVRRR